MRASYKKRCFEQLETVEAVTGLEVFDFSQAPGQIRLTRVANPETRATLAVSPWLSHKEMTIYLDGLITGLVELRQEELGRRLEEFC